MIKHLVTTTAVAALLAGGVALAQQKQPEDSSPKPPAAQQQMQDEQMNKQMPAAEGQSKPGEAKPSEAAASDMKQFITAQQETDWLSSDLLGVNVENQQGDNLGGISDIVFAESGEVNAVVIGVGGFLGIGAKSVAVPYEALEFKQREKSQDRPNLASNRQGAGSGNAPTPTTPNPAQPGSSAQNSQLRDNSAQGGGATDSSAKSQAEQAAERHDNIVIVLNATKEELEAAPSFKYLKAQAAEARSQRDRQQLDNNAQGTRGSSTVPRPAQ